MMINNKINQLQKFYKERIMKKNNKIINQKIL